MTKLTIGVAGKTLYVNGNTGNAKVGARGKVEPLPGLLHKLGKGGARRLRKALRASGMPGLAGLPALPPAEGAVTR